MTQNLEHFAKAMTAIAAVLAFSATQSFAQDAGTPPDPVADTSVQASESVDPAAAAPAADEPPVAADATAPPAPKPKVETSTAAPQRARSSPSGSTARPTARRASATTPAVIAATPATEAAAPAPLPAEAQPPAAVEPAAPPIAEQAPASESPNALMSDIMAEPMLPLAGAGALGLIVLGGAGIAMHRRKRRRADEEFEARQQALATIDDEPETLELDPAAEVRPGPVFPRTPAPIHDPVPDKNVPVAKVGWGAPADAGFMIRRAGNPAKPPVEQD